MRHYTDRNHARGRTFLRRGNQQSGAISGPAARLVAAGGHNRGPGRGRQMNGLLSVLLSSLLGGCLGAVAGSFLNVVIHRVPRMIEAGAEPVSLKPVVLGLALPAPSLPCP